MVISFCSISDILKVVANSDGNTPLHYLSRKKFSKEILQLLLDRGLDINARNAHGETALHNSCWGDISVCELLLQYGGNPDIKNNKNETPLHWSARLGRLEQVALLVKAGADVSL